MINKWRRIIRIDQELRAGRFPTAQGLIDLFLEEWGETVSERTIYDDLKRLRDELRAPLDFDHEHGGHVYTDPTFVLPAIYVTEGELIGLFIGQELIQRYLGTPFEAPLRSATDKIAEYLPDQVKLDLEQAKTFFTFKPGVVVAIRPGLVEDLHRAIRSQKKVRIYYYTAGRDEWNERTVSPHHIYSREGDSYLFAYDDLRQQMRNFHLGRIERWEVLNESFERQPDFSVETWMASAFQTERGDKVYDVVIRFDEYQARYVRERQWHDLERKEEQLGGGLIYRVPTAGLGEMQRWVMAFGARAEVLAPDELRTAVVEETARMAELYGH
ncbi:MAG TPA: WYL domain-containing protein [Anaerolineae bacterium]